MYKNVYLTATFRKEMNNPVVSLNEAIQVAVLDANNLSNRNVTHYVDGDSRFEGHPWCEAGVKDRRARRQS